MHRLATACLALSLVVLPAAPPALAGGARSEPAPDPVPVDSVEAARALDPGVTHVRLGAEAGDDVLRELARLEKLTAILAAESAVTDEGLRAIPTPSPLREVDLSRCAGVGPAGLKALSGLRKLEVLRLAGVAGLDDAAIVPLGKLARLRVVDLADCPGLGDGALEALRDLKLEELHLSGVPLTLRGLQNLARLQTLRVLRVERAGIPDEGMLSLVVLRNLEHLAVSGNPDFGYVGLLHLGGLRKLRTLEASGLPHVTDEALQRAAKMETLESLDFSNCAGLTDAGISALAASANLRSLDVSRTRVTRKGVLALEKAKRLSRLRIAGCPSVTPEDVAAARAVMPAVTIETE